MNQEQRNSLPVHRVSQSEWNEFATIAGLDHDGDGLDRCVHSAYLDLSRTLVGIATFADAGAWHRGTAGFLKMRLQELALLSPWSRDEFDAWHSVIASELINTSRDLAFPLTVGQAQKWINMSIKNGIALGERLKPGLSSVYEVAHVALDQIVLDGLRRKKGMPCQLVRGAWSKIDDYDDYMDCQRWIRQNLPGIPVEEEFRLWQEGRMESETTRVPNAAVEASGGASMSLEDRFRHLAGLEEEVEAERRERARRELEASDAFKNRYYPTIRKVCRAFARSVGWEYGQFDDERLDLVGLGPFIMSRKTPFQGCEDYSDGLLSLALYSPACARHDTSKYVLGGSAGTGGGEIQVHAEFTNFPGPILEPGEYGPCGHAGVYAPAIGRATFAADIDLDTFETLVADALTDEYKRLVQLYMDSRRHLKQ